MPFVCYFDCLQEQVFKRKLGLSDKAKEMLSTSLYFISANKLLKDHKLVLIVGTLN